MLNNVEIAGKQQVAAEFAARFADKIELIENTDSEYMVQAEVLLPAAEYLLSAGYEFLADITAVDYLAEGKFRLLYQVGNYQNADLITLKVEISREEPQVNSLCAVWKAANWLEREVYDMFGIEFAGHPDLRRILMWDGFEGWPLRKDFVHQPTKYQGRRRLD